MADYERMRDQDMAAIISRIENLPTLANVAIRGVFKVRPGFRSLKHGSHGSHS